MADGKTFYLSTAIPYVNAPPHLGFALESVQADVIARYRRLKGDRVFFSTGTDENALKNVLAARSEGIGVKELVDRNAAIFRDLKRVLNLSWDDFIRTTEERHLRGAAKFWQAVAARGDIFKKKYKGLYCVGCEEFKTAKELVNERCPEHPTKALEEVEEENYFFALSKYQKEIENLIVSRKIEIFPESRANEVISFVKQGLHDFSISRSRERAENWGVPVPGDNSQMMYVWFDALTNYVTALGYADEGAKFKIFWEQGDHVTHLIGKGVLRFHAVYWPAMLLSAGVVLPKTIFVHGYLTVGGEKISKSLGNVIAPSEVVEKYGVDAVRYFLLREIPTGEDGDFSVKKLEDRYNGDLANGIGNLVARVAALGEKISPAHFDFTKEIESDIRSETGHTFREYEAHIAEFRLNEALADIWKLVGTADKYINEKKPWAIADTDALRRVLVNAGYLVGVIANLLEPFLPETAEKICAQVRFQDSTIVFKKGDSLFPRLQ